jgi:hypothetical protein
LNVNHHRFNFAPLEKPNTLSDRENPVTLKPVNPPGKPLGMETGNAPLETRRMVFPKWTNKIPLVLLVSVVSLICFTVFAFAYWGSPKHYFVGYQPVQPIAFSHKLHAGELGMDCRYCHFNVEKGRHGGVPPTETCMNCHTLIKSGSKTGTAEIQKIVDAHEAGKPIEWVRIHKLADFAYFDHSAHVNKGVSCVDCHGRIDQMTVVRADQPLSMSWCLDCHRNPAPHIRDRAKITDLGWKPEGDAAELGREFMKMYNVQPRTDCSACHR